MKPLAIDFAYMLASVLMLAAIWQFLKPGRTRQGNLLGAAGITIALLATLASSGSLSLGAAFVGLAVGCGLGAFIGLRATIETAAGSIALLVTCTGLSSALIAGGILHDTGAVFDAANAKLDAAWKDIPESVKQANITERPVLVISGPTSLSAAFAAAFGGLITAAGLISFLKLTRSPLRKALPKFEEPRMIQLGLAVVCALLGLFLCAWPGAETFLWLLLIAAVALGYSLTIHLKIPDVPAVLAATVAMSGLSISAAGVVSRNTLMVIAGGLVASGAAVVAQAICQSQNVHLLGLIAGTQSSKTAASNDSESPSPPETKPEPVLPPGRVTPDPDAPIL